MGAAALGKERGFFGAGPSANDTQPLLKPVASISGDELDITAVGVAVNGCWHHPSTFLKLAALYDANFLHSIKVNLERNGDRRMAATNRRW